MFAYCRNNPVIRKDASGMEDICVTDDDDNNPLNDLGEVGGSAGGASGSGFARGYGSGKASGGTVIYRWNCKNAKNLMPSSKDAQYNSPMSFSTVYRPGSAMTTIEEINATGFLRAEQDGDTHVSVSPSNGTIAQWRSDGIASIWTKVLLEIVKFLK